MITKLTPEQVSGFWPVIKHAIEESLPPTVGEHPDKMNRILSAILMGSLDAWAIYERGEERVKMLGILVSKLTYDGASDTRALLIYTLYGYENLSDEIWQASFNSLVKYAKSKNCQRMTALSSVPRVTEMARELGANTDYTFISFDLNKFV